MWIGNASEELSLSEITDMVGAVRRNSFLIGAWVLLFVAGAAAFVYSARPQYVASTQFVLEQAKVAADAPNVLRFFHQLTLDDAQAQTQLQVLLSERLLRGVFDALGLQKAADLTDFNPTITDRIFDWWRPEQTNSESDAHGGWAFARFRDRVRARRIGLSYVLEASYWADDPGKASHFANAIATAFVRDRLDMATADAAGGFAPFTRRVERIRSEQLLAAASVRAGSVPDAYFPDAAVRLLGAATVPSAKTFPKSAPIIGIAFWLGSVSALLIVIAWKPMDLRQRLRRDIKNCFGCECFEVTSDLVNRRHGRLSRVRVLEEIRAMLAVRGCMSYGASIGILAANEDADHVRLAADLTELFAAARCLADVVDLTDKEVVTLNVKRQDSDAQLGGCQQRRAITIYAIPPLARSAVARGILSSLDAAILIVGVKRAKTSEIRGAVNELQQAKAPLVGVVLF